MSENPQNMMPMAIENPPPVAPALSLEEQSVLNGSVREKLTQSATTAGGIGGVVTGGIIGGIWSAVSNGKNWIYKTIGVAGALGIAGAVIGRATMDKQLDEGALRTPPIPSPIETTPEAPTHSFTERLHARGHQPAQNMSFEQRLAKEEAFEEKMHDISF